MMRENAFLSNSAKFSAGRPSLTGIAFQPQRPLPLVFIVLGL